MKWLLIVCLMVAFAGVTSARRTTVDWRKKLCYLGNRMEDVFNLVQDVHQKIDDCASRPGCEPLSTPVHGDLSQTGRQLGDTATVTCDLGFVLNGAAVRTCLASGWHGTAADCAPVSCPMLANPTDGSVSTLAGTEFGDEAIYSCDAGFELSGSDRRCCLSTGSWSGTVPKCVPIVECPDLTNPVHGTVDVSGLGPQPLGAKATYTCDVGLVTGDLERFCYAGGSSVGSWSGSAATCSPATLRDCNDVYDFISTDSGVYNVFPCTDCAVEVYCDMTTDGGKWTVFQRRKDGSQDFLLDWQNYTDGFGDLSGEFWLGLDNLYNIVSGGTYELRVDLEDFEDNAAFAKYMTFFIDPEPSNYTLTIGGYDASSTAGDSLMTHHNGRQFSTRDRDNDVNANSCAINFKGAWWYGSCHISNLNGFYYGGPFTSNADGVSWKSWKGNQYSLKTTAMMIRQRNR